MVVFHHVCVVAYDCEWAGERASEDEKGTKNGRVSANERLRSAGRRDGRHWLMMDLQKKVPSLGRLTCIPHRPSV